MIVIVDLHALYSMQDLPRSLMAAMFFRLFEMFVLFYFILFFYSKNEKSPNLL